MGWNYQETAVSTLCQTCRYLPSSGHHYLGHYQIIPLGDSHEGVNNLPEVAAQQCPNGSQSMAYELQVNCVGYIISKEV